MSDTERRAVEPWWVAGAKWLLASFLFPAAVATFVLVTTNSKLDRVADGLQEMKAVMIERLPLQRR